MTQPNRTPYALMIALGAVWGCSEAALGMGLKSCAFMASGSVMTAAALLFISAAWSAGRNAAGLILLLGVAVLLKGFDTILISVPFFHRAVANPLYAMTLQAAGFIFAVMVFRNAEGSKRGRMLLGGGVALFSALSFVFVGRVTGVPACVLKGTAIPQSVVFSPLAAGLSMITVPLGFRLGPKLAAWMEGMAGEGRRAAAESLIAFGMTAAAVLVIGLIHLPFRG